jgi:hypothetical protein
LASAVAAMVTAAAAIAAGSTATSDAAGAADKPPSLNKDWMLCKKPVDHTWINNQNTLINYDQNSKVPRS